MRKHDINLENQIRTCPPIYFLAPMAFDHPFLKAAADSYHSGSKYIDGCAAHGRAARNLVMSATTADIK